MPEPKRPLKVFLCHAHTDKPKVRELYRYLKKRGIQPWFDEEDLVGGQDWQVEIPKAIATSDAIIICLTKNSIDREGYIQKEIKFALDKALEMPEGRIFLIPVKFEECEVPFTLSRYQWVDLTVESGYAKMMKALKFRASQLERTTVELPKKAVEEENLALEKAAREKEEREAAEKVARERAEKDAVEKARLEAEEQTRQKAAIKNAERDVAGNEVVANLLKNKVISLESIVRQVKPLLWIIFIVGVVASLFWVGSWIMANLMTPKPDPTVASIVEKTVQALTAASIPSLPPTDTITPRPTLTKTITPKPTATKTKTQIPTPSPIEITLTTVPTVSSVTAIIDAHPTRGKNPLTVNFSANLKRWDGVLLCSSSSDCTYYWRVNWGSGSIDNLESHNRSVSYQFVWSGTRYMYVTVCYGSICDTTGVAIYVEK